MDVQNKIPLDRNGLDALKDPETSVPPTTSAKFPNAPLPTVARVAPIFNALLQFDFRQK
jgi:hypothetical protein